MLSVQLGQMPFVCENCGDMFNFSDRRFYLCLNSQPHRACNTLCVVVAYPGSVRIMQRRQAAGGRYGQGDLPEMCCDITGLFRFFVAVFNSCHMVCTNNIFVCSIFVCMHHHACKRGNVCACTPIYVLGGATKS